MHALDAIVVSYRTPGLLAAHLDSWRTCPSRYVRSLTVVLVDPIVEHHDREVLRTANFATSGRTNHAPHEAVIVHYANVGYGFACNHAAREAGTRADTIAFFNADTAVWPGSVDACVDALWADEQRGILGPRQTNREGRLTAAGIFGTLERPKHRGWKMDGRRGAYADVRDDAVYVSGSILFVKRHVHDELVECSEGPGTFMLETPLYFEESWACLHALGHGYLNTYLGTVTMSHYHDQSPAPRAAKHDKMRRAKEMFRATADAHDLIHE